MKRSFFTVVSLLCLASIGRGQTAAPARVAALLDEVKAIVAAQDGDLSAAIGQRDTAAAATTQAVGERDTARAATTQAVDERDAQAVAIASLTAALDAERSKPAATQPSFPGRLWHVSTAGNDAGAGTRGNPLRTISRAALLASPGDRVIVRNGTYREAVLLSRGGTADRPIAFIAETPGAVVVDGSDPLTNWTRHAGPVFFTPWSADFVVGTQSDGTPKRFMGLPAPAGCAEQVFFNSQRLTQVAALADLGQATFFVDWTADRLFVRLPGDVEPGTGLVEASSRDRLFMSRLVGGKPSPAHHIWIDGFTFRRAANFPQRGAVTTNTGWRLSNIIVEQANALGVGIAGDDVRLSDVIAQDNGQAGIGSGGSRNALLIRCTTRRNNYKGFSPGWEAGGGKISNTDGLTVIGLTAADNIGQGLWLDSKNTNYSIRASTFSGNRGLTADWQGAGLFIEISDGPGRVDGCRFERNSGAAIEICESMGVTVTDCTLIDDHLKMRNMTGRGSYALRDITVTGNRFAGLGIDIPSTIIGPDGSQSRIAINGNTYDLAPGKALIAWAGKRYSTIESVRSILKFEADGRVAPIDRSN